MDTALKLRMSIDSRQPLSDHNIDNLLAQSALVQKLTADFMEQPLFAVFRIMGLCEIPYAQKLPYTQKLIDYINQTIATDEGFACLGATKELVPCYNAMLLEAYSKLGMAASAPAQSALNWIKQYQLFERNQTTTWPYGGVCKHGGCLGVVPCYIGVGKTVRSLITYSEYLERKDVEIEKLIIQGVEYMLRHNMYQRLSTGKPISAHITDIMMPQNYALSLTDLTYIVGKRKLRDDSRISPLLSMLKEKQVAESQWKIDYLYSYRGYIAFESRRKASEWISYLFPLWLSD
ncbi:MAG: hypothetical protein LBU67_04080 [Oscillospiraceae bacterium]|jgi:hypothetical protein|nr:hypothetical protein [Oscillospiraceae bacterium]